MACRAGRRLLDEAGEVMVTSYRAPELRAAHAVAGRVRHYGTIDRGEVDALERVVRAALWRPSGAARWVCEEMTSFELPGDMDKPPPPRRAGDGPTSEKKAGGSGGRGGGR